MPITRKYMYLGPHYIDNYNYTQNQGSKSGWKTNGGNGLITEGVGCLSS